MCARLGSCHRQFGVGGAGRLRETDLPGAEREVDRRHGEGGDLPPIAGWTATTEKAKLPTPEKTDDGELTEVVSKITWTAAGEAVIQSGEFQEFDLSMGLLPKIDQLVFKALQTYADGDVVRWIECRPGTMNQSIRHRCSS